MLALLRPGLDGLPHRGAEVGSLVAPAPETQDVVSKERPGGGLVERRANVAEDRAGVSGAERLLEHDHAPPTGELRGDQVTRKRTVEGKGEKAHPEPFVAELVDRILDLVGHRSQRDRHVLRVVAEVLLSDRVPTAAEDGLELGVDALVDLDRLPELHVETTPDLHVSRNGVAVPVRPAAGERHRVQAGRVLGTELVSVLVGRQEGIDLLLLGDLEGHVGVGQVVAVVADHHRDADLLGEPEGLDDGVDDLLMILGVELDPAGVPL